MTTGWLTRVAISLPGMVGVLSGLVGLAAIRRDVRHEKLTAGAQYSQYYLLCAASLALVWPVLVVGLHDTPPRGALFYATLGGRADYQFLVAFVTSVAAARSITLWFQTGIGGRNAWVVVLTTVVVGLISSWTNLRATRNHLLVAPGVVQCQGFMDRESMVADRQSLKRVILFQRRRGVIGVGRDNPHIVMQIGGSLFDSFHVAKGRVEQLGAALSLAFPKAHFEGRTENTVDPAGVSIGQTP